MPAPISESMSTTTADRNRTERSSWLLVAACIVGILASLVISAGSVAINFQFAYALGANPIGKWTQGLTLAALDVLKVLTPLWLAAVWGRGQRGAIVAGIAIFALCTALSVAAGIGYIATNRAAITDGRAIAGEKHGALRRALRRVETSRERITEMRSAETLELTRDRLMVQSVRDHRRRWRTLRDASDRCRSSDPRYVSACGRVLELDEALAVAHQRDELDEQARDLRSKLEASEATGWSSAADPQIAAIAELIGRSAKTSKSWLFVLVALGIELGSGIGLFLASAPLLRSLGTGKMPAAVNLTERANPDAIVGSKPPSAIEIVQQFLDSRLVEDEAASMRSDQLYCVLTEMLRSVGVAEPLSQKAVGQMVRKRGIAKEKIGGRVIYKGVRLKPAGVKALNGA